MCFVDLSSACISHETPVAYTIGYFQRTVESQTSSVSLGLQAYHLKPRFHVVMNEMSNPGRNDDTSFRYLIGYNFILYYLLI